MTEGTKQQHTTNKEIKKYKIKHKTVSVKNYSLEFIMWSYTENALRKISYGHWYWRRLHQLGQHRVTRTSQNCTTGWYQHSRCRPLWTCESLASRSFFASRYLSEWYSGDNIDEYISLLCHDGNTSQLWWWDQNVTTYVVIIFQSSARKDGCGGLCRGSTQYRPLESISIHTRQSCCRHDW